ncbi:YciI family protein [Tsukamurella sp. 1534]|uniref:YciI family protein n=1 Tax=Tsukamurella sp. 1534 TaxID=1151061 RepID=UPI0005948BDC|nr:YciI family protein [Tsukamurella sp. 1534]
MTDYAVLLYGDEAAWEAASDAERRADFARHDQFTALLAQRGHEIVGGAELAPSRTASRIGRADGGGTEVRSGPYAEAVEQLGGFYLVRTDDLAGLQEITSTLFGDGGHGFGVEIREMLG